MLVVVVPPSTLELTELPVRSHLSVILVAYFIVEFYPGEKSSAYQINILGQAWGKWILLEGYTIQLAALAQSCMLAGNCSALVASVVDAQ